jgi:uncharacterized membrane protein YhaH (DUF805 family)
MFRANGDAEERARGTMGMFQAVGSVYANMFNFSGRARRAEYWWFVLFTYLVMFLIQGGFAYWLFTSPEFSAAMGNPQGMDVLVKRYEDQVWRWSGLAFVAMLFLYWIPQLAVTVRRLHDTGRSGWWMFKPILIGIAAAIVLSVLAVFTGNGDPSPALALMAATAPTAASIWFLVVLCLPGTHGTNRFGPDPIPDRPAPESGHPALVKDMDEELGRQVQQQRKQEFEEYYRARVLPAIERNKARRV